MKSGTNAKPFGRTCNISQIFKILEKFLYRVIIMNTPVVGRRFNTAYVKLHI